MPKQRKGFGDQRCEQCAALNGSVDLLFGYEFVDVADVVHTTDKANSTNKDIRGQPELVEDRRHNNGTWQALSRCLQLCSPDGWHSRLSVHTSVALKMTIFFRGAE